ncbi:MAG: hypothetical protein ABJA69_06395 [Acidobacteriaceae bacterium]
MSRRKSSSSGRKPIRIVPLHVPEDKAGDPASRASPPQLTYRNGPLLQNVEVFTIFWGTGWQRSPAGNLVRQINDFFNGILSSSLMDQLAEYSVPGKAIARGKFVGTVSMTTPRLQRSVSDAAIRKMLKTLLASQSSVPKPGPNLLYFIYIQPGTAVVQGGSASCKSFCGYHSDISGHTFYAVMPYPGCPGCTSSLDVLAALTSTSSHELCEAVTDPIPGEGWYDDANGEIGDICAWKTKQVGNFTVQLEWSNKANRCE